MPVARTRWNGVSSGNAVATMERIVRALSVCVVMPSVEPCDAELCGKPRVRGGYDLAMIIDAEVIS